MAQLGDGERRVLAGGNIGWSRSGLGLIGSCSNLVLRRPLEEHYDVVPELVFAAGTVLQCKASGKRLKQRSRVGQIASAAEMSPVDGERMAENTEPDEILIRDGRQSMAAAHIARGARRLLVSLGLTSTCELPLPNGRRADIVALSRKNELWIIEIKSSIEDFRSDFKWHEYRDYCDRLFFAVSPDFPQDILPPDTGLIVADRYGAEMVRPAPESKLAAHTRRALTLRYAMCAAARQQAVDDPSLALELIIRGD